MYTPMGLCDALLCKHPWAFVSDGVNTHGPLCQMVCLQCKHPWAFIPSLLQVVHHAEECKGGAESCVEDDACRTKFGMDFVKPALKYHGTYKHACMHSHTADQAI